MECAHDWTHDVGLALSSDTPVNWSETKVQPAKTSNATSTTVTRRGRERRARCMRTSKESGPPRAKKAGGCCGARSVWGLGGAPSEGRGSETNTGPYRQEDLVSNRCRFPVVGKQGRLDASRGPV